MIGILAYAAVGYPCLVYLMSRLFPRPMSAVPLVPEERDLPSVTMVIAAYNEETVIVPRIENALSLRYPKDRLNILVVSDGSTDRTPERVSRYSAQGVRSLHTAAREGKTAALNRAAAAAAGEILLFSDANNHFNADAVMNLVRHFADPEVGGVSGRKAFLREGSRFSTEGETAYWGYESFLKECESRVGSIATADGEIFAMRRSLFTPIPNDIVHDDLAQTLEIVRKGYRVIYEPAAVSSEPASKSPRDEYHIKVRMAAGGYQILSRYRELFFPPRSLFAVLFLSHKLFRWALPVWLIGLFVSNLFLAGPFYRLTLIGQLILYAAGLSAALIGPGRFRLFYFPYYFLLTNLAALDGLIRFLRGTQRAAWRKAER
jgi:cellulose synthase/poly-beta-1,6-N-acetylglucosamine synthase-like glycosyltransferase